MICLTTIDICFYFIAVDKLKRWKELRLLLETGLRLCFQGTDLSVNSESRPSCDADVNGGDYAVL